MFKKNTAVVGFGIGNFINASTGATVTTGTPVETRIIDGTGAALTNAATYNTNASEWEIDLDAADMNGDVIGLTFKLTDCLPISYTIKTVLGVPQTTIAADGEYDTEMARITDARMGALTDWINGGRLDAILDVIAADTTTDIPGLIAALDTVVDRIETDTQDIQTQIGTAGAGLSDIGGMSNAMKTEINNEITDVLKTDTIAEMSQGAPPASPTMEQVLNYLYRQLRNKIETTGSETAVYNDAGTTKIHKSPLTDNGTTFTKSEAVSGA